jgi:hypothetical protein
MLSSGNFQSAPTSPAEAAAFRAANLEAGYRLRPDAVTLELAHGATQLHVAMHWLDDGVAPTYLAWRPVLVLAGPSNVEVPLAFELRQVLPDEPGSDDESPELPQALVPGAYTVSLRVDDVQGISPPLQLGLAGRTTDGSYPLGVLQVP